MQRGIVGVIVVLLLWVMSVPAVWGDATVETFFKTGGIKGMGGAEGMMSHRIQGEKKWDSSNLKFTGAFLSKLAGETDTVTITRVDKGLTWTLDPKKKTYLETPIKPVKGAPSERPLREEKPEKPTARITQSEFSVKKTGAAENINGFPCEEYLVAWLLEIEDLETKAKSRSTMNTNLWTTPETTAIKKVQAEEERFNRALAKLLGSEISTEEARQMGMAAMAAMSKASPEEIQKGLHRVKNEMAKIKGYPIRTVINWNLESEGKEGGAREDSASRDKPTDLSGGLGGLVSGLLGKAVQKKAEEKMSGGKGAPFFSSTTEVKSLNADSIPPENFEIPTGYAKK